MTASLALTAAYKLVESALEHIPAEDHPRALRLIGRAAYVTLAQKQGQRKASEACYRLGDEIATSEVARD